MTTVPAARPMTEAEIPWGRVRPQRQLADKTMKVVCIVSTALGVFVLGWILGMLAWQGLTSLSPRVFTQVMPGPGSEGGGLANAIVGSLILTFLGIAVATPVGVLAGTYLAEYGKTSKLAEVVRFINDILLSAPSILIGLFVYTLMVQPMGGYSGWAGAVGACHVRRACRVFLGVVAGRHAPAYVLLRPPSVPGGDHPPCHVALSPVHAQLPRCGGAPGRARDRDLL